MFRLKAMIALLLALCLFLPACQKQEGDNSLIPDELIVPEKGEYKTSEVSVGSLSSFSTGRAKVEYVNSRKLSWSVSNCVISKVFVSNGANVKQGDSLISFIGKENSTALEARRLALSQREMEVAETKNSKLAAIDEARMQAQDLTSYERIIADQQILKLQIDYEQYLYETDIELEDMRKELADLEFSAEEKIMTAPFDGEVKFLAELIPGNAVTAGKELVELFSYEEFILVIEDTSVRYNMEVFVDMAGGNYTGRIITAPNVLPAAVSDSTVRIKINEDLEAKQILGRIT